MRQRRREPQEERSCRIGRTGKTTHVSVLLGFLVILVGLPLLIMRLGSPTSAHNETDNLSLNVGPIVVLTSLTPIVGLWVKPGFSVR